MRRLRTTALKSTGQPAAPIELLDEVRRLELRTRRLVDSRFSGEYLSTFKGQGIEFAEVRPYQPGDDVRSIDWNVTARLGEPFVKRYVEERELSVVLVVDLSSSDRWATRGRLKSRLIAEVAVTLAMSATRNNDRVGLMIVTDSVERFIPARKGRRHVLRLLRELLSYQPVNTGTNLASAVDYAQRVLPHRSLIFLFSDFRLGNGWKAFGEAVSGLRARHDVIACHLVDPGDVGPPAIGLLHVTDPETGERRVVHTGSTAVRDQFEQGLADDRSRARRTFGRLGIDEILLRTDQPFAPALIGFFRRRERRMRR